MKYLVFYMAVTIMISGCGTKPITAPYYKPVTQPIVVTKDVAISTIYKPTPKMISPKAEGKIYSFHEYSRFMFEEDCEELIFRQEELLHELKNNPLDIIDVMSDVKKNLIKNHCKY